MLRAKDRRRLAGNAFTDETVRGIDLRNALAYQCVWKNCSFEDVRFDRANLAGGVFLGCVFTRCSFTQAILTGEYRDCRFDNCDFDQSDWTAAYIENTTLENCRFQYATFFRATVKNGRFLRSNLHGTNFDLAESLDLDLTGSNLWGVLYPINCAGFVLTRFDDRQIDFFLALLLNGRLSPQRRSQLEAIVPDRATKVIERLVAQEAEVPVSDRMDDRRRPASEVGHDVAQHGSRDREDAEGRDGGSVANA